MTFKVLSAKKLQGSIELPASKSYSIRAFFVAACGGSSTLIAPSDCDDAKVALRVARAFGAKVTRTGRKYFIEPSRAVALRKSLAVDVGESGTSLRFVLPLLPFYSRTARVSGKGTLVGRPNGHLCEALRGCGLDIKGIGPKESVPISFKGGEIKGGLISVDGSVSSQFISALMIACPRAVGNTRLLLTGKELVSRDYIVMTRQILARAGIRILQRSAREFVIPGGQEFDGLQDFHVPSDYGLAAFFMVAAALLDSDVTLKGKFDNSLVQSDGAILGFLRKMGVRMKRTGQAIHIQGPALLKGGVFSLKDCPDLVPIMAVAAMFAKGQTHLKDIGHARVKESDRISDLRKELLKVGARIEERPGELIIYPQDSYKKGVALDPHHDHRLAMAFAVLGLRVGVSVKDMECTAKSYPGFVKALRSLGA
ncbi:MAG: 3-phosphoshikimate 1-carboxyvinyltransferase [Candidatus Omnitrophica bacterium]|nr:3-phosphoshikimate 1-carboxyvinyltransferase [Candidatus Omnitrophota bacterium]